MPKSEEYETSFVKIIVGKVTDDVKEPIMYVDGKCSNYDNVSLETELDRGEYIALVEIDWKCDNLVREYVFSTYSAVNDVKLEKVERPDFLEEVLKSCARCKSTR